MDENIQKLQQMIDESPRIVFFAVSYTHLTLPTIA